MVFGDGLGCSIRWSFWYSMGNYEFFHAIGLSNDATLATVAPGIAEALFATALGLVAAIPAVVAYNKLSSDLDRCTVSADFSASLGYSSAPVGWAWLKRRESLTMGSGSGCGGEQTSLLSTYFRY